MLEPITKRVTEESGGGGFRFTFYCDICGSTWQSVRYGAVNPSEREDERLAAYERANREAILHFNRCPVCKRVVCDNCFRILDELDMCKECMSAGAQ